MVLSIELENNVWQFNPGQSINGKVVIDKRIWNKVEGLTIRFYGKLEVGPKSNSLQPPPPPTAPTSSSNALSSSAEADVTSSCVSYARRIIGREINVEEVLLDHTINLLDNWKVLKPGRHEFEFTTDLPMSLPPSCKVKSARIHYEFVTSLKRPRDDFKVYQTPFYISSSMDEYAVEDFQELWTPCHSTTKKNVSQFLGCCLNGDFAIEVKLNQRIFPVGGNIQFSCFLKNDLRSNLNSVIVVLIRKFQCKKMEAIKEVVAEVEGPTVTSGETQVWVQSLQIPNNIPPTNLLFRELFEIHYALYVKATPSNYPSKELRIKIPLTLVPSNVFTVIQPTFESSYENLQPPSYDEAVQQEERRKTIVNDDQQSTSHLLPSEIS